MGFGCRISCRPICCGTDVSDPYPARNSAMNEQLPARIGHRPTARRVMRPAPGPASRWPGFLLAWLRAGLASRWPGFRLARPPAGPPCAGAMTQRFAQQGLAGPAGGPLAAGRRRHRWPGAHRREHGGQRGDLLGRGIPPDHGEQRRPRSGPGPRSPAAGGSCARAAGGIFALAAAIVSATVGGACARVVAVTCTCVPAAAIVSATVGGACARTAAATCTCVPAAAVARAAATAAG